MPGLVVGQSVPSFRLPDLSGRLVSLEDFRGRPALINFWSAECPWSERADRALIGWLDRLALVSVASNANEPLDLLRSVAQMRGLPIVLVDAYQQVAGLYGVQITPHCFLIDAAGLLRYQGAPDDVSFRQRQATRSYILEALTALESGQPAPLTETAPFGCTIVRHEAL